MTTSLTQIIEESYTLFEHYTVEDSLDVCTDCCMTPEQERQMINLAVRSISFDLLYEYNTAAKTEKPAIEEFKHFLPRILELTASFKFTHHSVELVFSRFQYYDKTDWTAQEQALIENFTECFFKQCLNVYPIADFGNIESIIIMLSATGIDSHLLLTFWQSTETLESTLHFHSLLTDISREKRGKLSNPFSKSELDKALFTWANQELIKDLFAKRIEKIILEPSELSESLLQELSWTYELLTFR